MDSFTHLVAGALTPIAFSRAPRSTGLVLFGILAGEFPDVDIILGNSPKALLALHRGLTHALLAQPVWAVLLATIFYFLLRGDRKRPPASPAPPTGPPAWSWPVFFTAALAALCLHLYLDCMTTFGTQILLPFSHARIWFPAVFIIDPVLTLPAATLLGLILMPKRRPGDESALFSRRAKLYARAGLAWLVLYPLLSLGINQAATAILAPRLAPEPDAKLTLLTEPFSPLVWKAVVEKAETLEVATIFLTGLNDLPALSEYPKANPELLNTLGAQNSIFTDFRNFGSFVTQTARPGPGSSLEYSFMELRYVVSRQSPLRKLGRTRANFVLEARVTPDGRLLAWRFLSNSGDNSEWRPPEDNGR